MDITHILPEEVFFLLLTGRLPRSDELEDLQNDFSANFELKFNNFPKHSSNIFLQFPAAGSARWRLGARSALDISASPAKRRHGVENLVSNPPSPASLDLSRFKL